MATMFGLIASDVVMEADCLQVLLTRAVNHSFNCVTVDDTSTNDVCAIVATQQAGHAVVRILTVKKRKFLPRLCRP